MELSVLLSTRDRAPLLASTLEHLCRQEGLPAGRWEVLVVDNGSRDDTPAVLGRFASRLPLVALRQPQGGKSHALNRALEVARGALRVFTDDDVEPRPSWLAELLAASRRWPDHPVFGGRIIPRYPAETPDWLRDLVREHPEYASAAYAHYSLPQEEGPTEDLPFGPNYAVRAQAMTGLRFCEDIGPVGKDYPMGEDTDMLIRLTRRGVPAIYVPGAMVYHVVRPDQLQPSWLLGRAYRLGRGTLRLRVATLGQPLPPAWKAWLRLPLAWALYGRERFRGPGRRLLAGVSIHFLRGYLLEHSRLRAERAGS
ncbi:MAG TPA: glycosyltransferase [Thermoanaerobaculia bacterium]|nr:glycosyltransferase [Thermoanaerobaculia bacterium]